eukprot:scaffold372691_cov37-Prasinocladus_malaysianus.AAC.1
MAHVKLYISRLSAVAWPPGCVDGVVCMLSSASTGPPQAKAAAAQLLALLYTHQPGALHSISDEAVAGLVGLLMSAETPSTAEAALK